MGSELVMYEIEFKQMTDGSEIQEDGETEEVSRNAAAKDLQHYRDVLETHRSSNGPNKQRKRAAASGKAQHN